MKATFELEAIELELSGGPIAGVDESGRRPLAGPVVAAAVVLDPAFIPHGIADSKALDGKARRSVYRWPPRPAATARCSLLPATRRPCLGFRSDSGDGA